MRNIEAAVTEKTKALLICNPDNPVGTVYTKKELEGIAKIAVEKDIVVITDEIYTEFVWGDRKHLPIINMPGMWERTMVLMSFSKTFAWTGCRAGYIIAGPELMKLIANVPTGITSVPVPFQRAGIEALKHGWDFVKEMRKAYEERIKYFVPRLNEIEGVSAPYPEGAFFQKERVRVAPGTQYGANGEGHIRFALVRPIENLEDAATRLERFIKNLPAAAPQAFP
jgi:aminotransferase